jgi:hypothetical protein
VAPLRAELSIWHAAWQRARGASHFDFNNQFGWHALPATDPVWHSASFTKQWMEIASNGCREADGTLAVASGPLHPSSALKAAAERLLPSSHELIAVSGSGTEAVLSFYDARCHRPEPRSRLAAVVCSLAQRRQYHWPPASQRVMANVAACC